MTRRFAMLLLVAAGAFCSSQAHAQPTTAVAVVDVQRAFDSLREKTQIEAVLQEAANRIKEEDAQRLRRISDLDREIFVIVRDTPKRRQKEEERDLAVLDRQVWFQMQQARLNHQRSLLIEAVYKKLLVRIGQIARANGYQIVLLKEPQVDLSTATPGEINASMNGRKMLWSADEVDLTEQITGNQSGEFLAPSR